MKILLAINSMNLNMAAIDFACYLTKINNATLTGVFLDNTEYQELPVSTAEAAYGTVYDAEAPELKRKRQLCNENILRFKEACEERETTCRVHRDRGIPFDELVAESRFADVLLVEAGFSLPDNQKETPGIFVKRLLTEAECPVIVTPESNNTIEEIVFMYNGSASAVFAIKQFTYLFPAFRNTRLTVTEVNDEGMVTKRHHIQGWLKERYSDVDFTVLQGDEQNRLVETAYAKDKCIIVMGAYGRSSLSNFFKKSHAASVIKVTTQPLFITHY